MATSKKTAAPAKAAPAKTAKAPVAAAQAVIKPVKERLNKTALIAHLAQAAAVEPKAVKAVMTALEQTILGSIGKKGAGEFILPGLMKVSALQVPATKKRTGIDPFTKLERTFAAKPASVKVKVRVLKKLKDAA